MATDVKQSAVKRGDVKHSDIKHRAVRKKAKSAAPDAGVMKVSLRDTRISPRKARLVIDLIKGKEVDHALRILQFSAKKGGDLVTKLLASAVANVSNKGGIDVDSLYVSAGWVDMGKTIKRFMPRAQGRATPIKKRSAHITLVLGTR